MLDRTTRLKLRRKYKRGRQHVEGLGDEADKHLDRHFFRRVGELVEIRRFIISWVLLFVLLGGITIVQTRALSGYYLEPVAVEGGTYTEGMVGAFTNASPLYATGMVDKTVSRLVFAGLLKHDENGNLATDLAQSWQVNEAGDRYVVTLKPNLFWHDGQPLTAEDVVYTFDVAGHPDAKSPFFDTWRQVGVEAKGNAVVFTLENALAAFPYSLTTGIVPKHLLSKYTPEQLRSANFNTLEPVGSGPFKWQVIETVGTNREKIQQHIGLERYTNYHGGRVGLDSFLINTFTSREQLIEAFEKQQISAMVGLDQLSDEFIGDDSVYSYETPMWAANMAFLRTDSEFLNDAKVRRALIQSLDVPQMLKSLDYPVIAVDEPVMKDHSTYTPAYKQYGKNIKTAKKLLDESGWKYNPATNTRTKGKKTMVIKIYGQNTPDFDKISQLMQKAWSSVGVSAEVLLQSAEDLQGSVSNRVYDVLLTGVTTGADPDVFVYWHSSQADPRSKSRLNFSNYKSDEADTALETARTRLNPRLRKVKIEPFLQSWKKDVPAIGLYQPRFLYISRGEVFGFGAKRFTEHTDRFWNVEHWMIREDNTVKQ
jgi:peptide/nickel transport system substrate-binding protein